MGSTVRDLAVGATKKNDGRPVLLAPNRPSLGWSDLRTAVDDLAASLRLAGIQPGDVVAYMLPSGPEAVTVFLASTSAGIAAPLNPAYRAAELGPYLDDLKPKLMILPESGNPEGEEACSKAGIPVARAHQGPEAGTVRLDALIRPCDEPVSPRPDDVALILHTSGTTSRPKMVPLRHSNLVASAAHVAETLQLGPADRCLNVMPLFHIHGLVAALLASLSAGSSLVATPGFEGPLFLRWMEETQPTWYTAVPTIHQAILDRTDATADTFDSVPLRMIRSSSASLAPTVMRRLEDTFAVPVVEAYGMTEAAHQITCNPLPPGHRRPGTVGTSAGPQVSILGSDGIHTRPDEVGEVVIRGPNVMTGYAGSPEANEKAFVDGWFRTGDLGHLDTDGYLTLTGRSKEMINRGGETIAPREIEEVLLSHEGVGQAVTFGVPDRRLGEQVAAAVVARAESRLDETTLRRFAEAHLTFAKIPRKILFMDSIPLGPTGKPQRIGLAARLGLSDLDDSDGASGERTPPRTRTEELVARLWAEVLGREEIAVEERFLELGGDSMLAMKLLARVGQALGIQPSMVEFFDRPTVAAQASLIDEMLLADA
jgi:acyl-CoA synthetase (AMP-forming)/AMP-acid ligase II/acyl carrier protein